MHNDQKREHMKTIGWIMVMAFLAWGGTRVVSLIRFDQNCEGYLKRAADANTVKLAEENLSIAVDYASVHDLNEGYTSLLWRTPDEDVGFWFDNLSSSLEELRSVSPNASQLERSNLLIKLRETLLDHSSNKGDSVTTPSGIEVFPNNKGFALWGLLSFVFAALFLTIGYAQEDDF